MLWGSIAAAIVAALLKKAILRAIFRRWPRTGKWALVPASAIRCPGCGTPPPAVRLPRDRQELLWGGNTCSQCGTRYDKHGVERVP